MKKATIGQTIVFQRKELAVIGKVEKHLDNSVIVNIPVKDAKELGYESPLTVVNHKNYKIIS